MTFDDLLALALQLSPDGRRRLADALRESLRAVGIRDSGAIEYSRSVEWPGKEFDGMKSVTVNLPDDLVKQAQAAGLFAEKRIEELLRRALDEANVASTRSRDGGLRRRRLIRQNGRLVVEAIPGEQPITDDEVRDLINKMEW